ncbi:MAG: hypothetical protein J7J80_08305 [Thermotogae bacterium]|nr:hypothetical protein [Thermotogota bacterium]
MREEAFRLKWVIVVLLLTSIFECLLMLTEKEATEPFGNERTLPNLWIFDEGVYYRIDTAGRIVGSSVALPNPREWVFSDVKWEIESGYRNRLSNDSLVVISKIVYLFPDLVNYVSDVMVSHKVVYAVGRKKVEFADWEIVFEHPEVFVECVTSKWRNVSLRILNDGSVLRVGW